MHINILFVFFLALDWRPNYGVPDVFAKYRAGSAKTKVKGHNIFWYTNSTHMNFTERTPTTVRPRRYSI